MKHAASVHPEPGSNSPLSESLCPYSLSLPTQRTLDSFRFVRLIFLKSTGIFYRLQFYSIVNVRFVIFATFPILTLKLLLSTIFSDRNFNVL